MGNGSSHGKDAKRVDQPPKGARVVGDDGKITRFECDEDQDVKAAKLADNVQESDGS